MLGIRAKGFSLVELMVAVGLFSVVMTLAMGAYLVMINANRQARALTTGIDNLSYALETMTRNIRTGSGYDTACGGSTFSFTDAEGVVRSYARVPSTGTQYKIRATVGTETNDLTDPLVDIKSLSFTCDGSTAAGDAKQAHVTIVLSGTVSAGPGKTKDFYVQTGATMRGTDL